MCSTQVLCIRHITTLSFHRPDLIWWHHPGYSAIRIDFTKVVAVAAKAMLRSNPALEAKLQTTRALLRHKAYRDVLRQRLLAYRDEQLLQQRMIIPRLSG